MSRRVVLFDVMDTLVRDPFREEMPAFFGMSLADMMAAKHPRAWVEFELAQRTEAEFLRGFFEDGRGYDHEGFRAAVFGGYRLLDGIPELLGELAAQGVEMHAASNYPCWWREIEARTGLSRWLRWSFVSCEIGVRKPDARFFEHALAELDVGAEQVVFVDDQLRNVEAARSLGIEALRFEGAEGLASALRELRSSRG